MMLNQANPANLLPVTIAVLEKKVGACLKFLIANIKLGPQRSIKLAASLFKVDTQ